MIRPEETSEEALATAAHVIFANSARGATFLIVLQVGSRSLTFVINQILLRYLSPELLGLSTQLELYAISVLYFARESLRVVLQRQGSISDLSHGNRRTEKGPAKPDTPSDRTPNSPGKSLQAQRAINLSYIAVMLGPPLAVTFAWLFLRKADQVLATPYIRESIFLYGLSTILELCIEPYFVVAQQQMLYGVRASAETTATLLRCILTCTTAIWASKSGHELGALPFAIGQLSFALALNLVYYKKIKRGPPREFSLLPKRFPIR